SNAISSDHLVRCWINDRKNVLVLEVDVDLTCNWIVLRHPRFAVEMQSLDDLVLLHIDDGLRLAALVRNIKFVKRSGVRAAIRLSLRGQLLDDLHLFQIDHANRVVSRIRGVDLLQFWDELNTLGSRHIRYCLHNLIAAQIDDVKKSGCQMR